MGKVYLKNNFRPPPCRLRSGTSPDGITLLTPGVIDSLEFEKISKAAMATGYLPVLPSQLMASAKDHYAPEVFARILDATWRYQILVDAILHESGLTSGDDPIICEDVADEIHVHIFHAIDRLRLSLYQHELLRKFDTTELTSGVSPP